jgi:monoamine oxidase
VNPIRPWNSPSKLTLYNFISVEDWLAQQGYSKDIQVIFSDLGPAKQSMLALLALMASGNGKPFFYESESFIIEGGTTSLVEAFTDALRDTVFLNCIVHSVETENDHAIVKFKRPDRNLECCHTKAIIITIPPCCWCNIAGIPTELMNLAPAMSQNRKISLIADIDYLFEEFCLLTDHPCRMISIDSLSKRSQKKISKVNIFACPFLSKNQITQLDIINTAIRMCHLETIKIISIYEEQWNNSFWSQGTYPMFTPGLLNSNYNFLVQGIPPFFFAGDYIIPGLTGYMEGSLRSAEKAVQRIVSFL